MYEGMRAPIWEQGPASVEGSVPGESGPHAGVS